jgi:hypothetical protein
MKECEIVGCELNGQYHEHLNLTLCDKHKVEHEEELYWEQYYKENGLGAYAGQPKSKS